jgi:hypothetical protein
MVCKGCSREVADGGSEGGEILLDECLADLLEADAGAITTGVETS